MSTNNTKVKFIFWGSSEFSVTVLETLLTNVPTSSDSLSPSAPLIPSAIVTTVDKPKGRRLTITPNPVKTWAEKNNIKVFTPQKLDDDFKKELGDFVKKENIEVSVVASYGKIMPEEILNILPKGSVNIHPSLLPQYRGASPLQQAILDDAKKTGVTIIKMDKLMDHGPIVAQEEIVVKEWTYYEEFEAMMAQAGAKLLAKILPDWVSGKIIAKEQDHAHATFTRKITKEDAEIKLADDPYQNYRKICAYHRWPQAFFMHNDPQSQRTIRVKITEVKIDGNKLIIEKVIPEGKKEMPYSIWRGVPLE